MKLFFILSLLFVSLTTHAHKIKCVIYDLAGGENLIESQELIIRDEQLLSNKPFSVNLDHYLIKADFYLSYSDEHHLLFEVRTQEVVNAEYAKFTVPLSKIPMGRAFKLGHVATELTGMGNNTHSSCSMIFLRD